MFLAAKMNEFECSTCTICLTGTLSKLSIQELGFTACTVVTFALKPARVFSKMIIDFHKSSESILRRKERIRSLKVPFFFCLIFVVYCAWLVKRNLFIYCGFKAGLFPLLLQAPTLWGRHLRMAFVYHSTFESFAFRRMFANIRGHYKMGSFWWKLDHFQ